MSGLSLRQFVHFSIPSASPHIQWDTLAPAVIFSTSTKSGTTADLHISWSGRMHALHTISSWLEKGRIELSWALLFWWASDGIVDVFRTWIIPKERQDNLICPHNLNSQVPFQLTQASPGLKLNAAVLANSSQTLFSTKSGTTADLHISWSGRMHALHTISSWLEKGRIELSWALLFWWASDGIVYIYIWLLH